MLERRILTAEVVYNGLGTPRANGAVVVQRTGDEEQVVAVESLENAQRTFPDAPVQDVGFALTPPLVNAHIDLTGVDEQAGKQQVDALPKSAESLGVVAKKTVVRYLLESSLKGVAYWEITAPRSANPEQAFVETVEKLRSFKAMERDSGMRVGLAFSTPGTLNTHLLQKLTALAKQNRLPLRFYLSANKRVESEKATAPASSISRLKTLGLLDAQPSLVHKGRVNEQEVQSVQRAGCVVIYCPRSSPADTPFPWELYAKHGVTVALGTDSLGSSPTLSIEDEVRAAKELHGVKVSSQALVWSAVKGGYRALGMKPPQLVRGDPFSAFHRWD